MQIRNALIGGFMCAALSSAAHADLRAGSLVMFPEFDNTPGSVHLLTLTNTSATESVVVEMIYIDGDDCGEFNRHIELTPYDTITVLTSAHNPAMTKGYAYAFAKDAVGGDPISFNYLTGSSFQINGGWLGGQLGDVAPARSLPPFVFQATGDEGEVTESNGDGLRNLDGTEYEPLPDRVVIPRFMGQGSSFGAGGTGGQYGGFTSRLYAIGLTGGTRFETTIDFLVFNDNEEVFSAEYSFGCWSATDLEQISGTFSRLFLATATNHDPNEILGFPRAESGWMIIDGAVANSATTTYQDPAVLFLLAETPAGGDTVAHLPYFEGEQDNGSLLARSLDGTF